MTNYLLHVSVFVTPSSDRPLRYLLKSYMLYAMLLPNVQYTLFFKIYSAVPLFKTI